MGPKYLFCFSRCEDSVADAGAGDAYVGADGADAGADDADADAGIPIRVTVHKVHLSNTLRAAHDTPEMINFEHD